MKSQHLPYFLSHLLSCSTSPSSRMNNDATIVPYYKYGVVSGTAASSDESIDQGIEGKLVRRNRLLAVNGDHQEFCVHEEVVLTENNFHRERLEREMWESRRRIDEHGAALEHRSQQLLNYTHEHVEQSIAESERKIEAYMEDKIKTSKDNVHGKIQEQTQTLAHQIQEKLYAERQKDVNDMEIRFAQQSSQFYQAIEHLEQRNRADVRAIASAQVQGLNEKLTELKLWTREHVNSTLLSQVGGFGSTQSEKMLEFVDQRIRGHEHHLEDLISARIRDEKDTITKSVQDYTSQAHMQLLKRVDNKIATLTTRHDKSFEEFKKEIRQTIVDVQHKAQSDLADFDNAVGSRIKAEIGCAINQHENEFEHAIQQQLQHEQLRRADTTDAKVAQAARNRTISSEESLEPTAKCDRLRSQLQVNFVSQSLPDKIHGLSASRSQNQDTIASSRTAGEPRPTTTGHKCSSTKNLTTTKKPSQTKTSRRNCQLPDLRTTKQTRLEQIRAQSIREVAQRASQRAAALDRSHRMMTRSGMRKQKEIS